MISGISKGWMDLKWKQTQRNSVTSSPAAEQSGSQAQEAEISAPSRVHQPCPMLSTDFKGPTSSFCHMRILL